MYSGAAIWNSLPCDVKAAISANSFKSRYLQWRKQKLIPITFLLNETRSLASCFSASCFLFVTR